MGIRNNGWDILFPDFCLDPETRAEPGATQLYQRLGRIWCSDRSRLVQSAKTVAFPTSRVRLLVVLLSYHSWFSCRFPLLVQPDSWVNFLCTFNRGRMFELLKNLLSVE